MRRRRGLRRRRDDVPAGPACAAVPARAARHVVGQWPGFAAFVGWAAASWLITGEAFAQFTSQYGNAAILAQSGQTMASFGDGT